MDWPTGRTSFGRWPFGEGFWWLGLKDSEDSEAGSEDPEDSEADSDDSEDPQDPGADLED